LQPIGLRPFSPCAMLTKAWDEIASRLAACLSFLGLFEHIKNMNIHTLEATFSNGVLTIVLPKSAEAQKAEKTIDIKRV
jgi:hypothetical protein